MAFGGATPSIVFKIRKETFIAGLKNNRSNGNNTLFLTSHLSTHSAVRCCTSRFFLFCYGVSTDYKSVTACRITKRALKVPATDLHIGAFVSLFLIPLFFFVRVYFDCLETITSNWFSMVCAMSCCMPLCFD